MVSPRLLRMPGRVSVCCTARLHLGFLDMNGGQGRRFGSIGLTLDAPITKLTITRASRHRIEGPEQDRASAYLTSITHRLELTDAHELTIERAIPAHSGLGSGTQLALAVAAAVRTLHGLALDPHGDAQALGRGARSGIGIGAFVRGGLLVDGGHGEAHARAPLLARMEVPDDWRIVLVLDHTHQGLSGTAERDAFARLPPQPAADAARVCRLVLMQALPAVAEADLERFGAAIADIQRIMGDHFAPAQSGRFTSARVAAALSTLAANRAAGIGQSSWGPTGFAFARGDDEAGRLAGALASARGASEPLDIQICRALNRGATITTG
jgi:beta-ribofuranosylaminobenzene 5'-phosphate synthase